MIDKQLLRLLGSSRKYIFFTVASMAVGLLANLAITSGICWAISLLAAGTEASAYIAPAICGAVGIAVRYAAGRTTGYLKDLLGRKAKKDLRKKTYDKIVRLGVRSADGMSIAGLTQVAMEGIEQLDLYYSSYIPQFFFAMLAPLILFGVTVGIDAKVAVVLLCCVPLIPVSIIAVSKYAKKIFAKYWGKYTSMGDSFLDSVQGLRELKIFRADAARHEKMNQNAEEFRKITMASLITLLGSLAYIMVLAVINGSLGFVCAMGVTLFGAVGIAKALGETIALSYGWIIALAIGCGVLRGLLRYLEQYGNHYIAFRLLAVLRDKIFGALRTLCPAKLESKKKGSIIAMITSDIETLEVFYAHTISPICIAVIVSAAVFIFVGTVSHRYIALVALAGYILVGIVLPMPIKSASAKKRPSR